MSPIDFDRANAIICNEENAKKLLDAALKDDPASAARSLIDGIPRIGPLRLFVSKHLPTFILRWESGFGDHRDRFIEWEPSDVAWSRPLGIGRWVETLDEAIYLMRLGAAPLFELSPAFVMEHGQCIHKP